jgi:putative exosortase-associated protein (TIGR04073 family)
MRKVLNFAMVLLVTAMLCSPALADGPMDKLQRGAVNTTTGWLELGHQPMLEMQHSDQPVLGAFLGFGKGILAGLQRTGYGLSDALSFPLAPHDRPVMEPETLFEGK